jgi:hypothetical protein
MTGKRDLSAMAEKLNLRPHVITVGDRKIQFHLVHASLHPFADTTPELFNDSDLGLYEVAKNQEDLVHSLTAERGLWRWEMDSRADGLAFTCCGHSVVDSPHWSLGHLNLDTGAGLDSAGLSDRKLTAFCFQTKEMISIPLGREGNVRRYFVPRMKKKRKNYL